jgi:hypothetical protein
VEKIKLTTGRDLRNGCANHVSPGSNPDTLYVSMLVWRNIWMGTSEIGIVAIEANGGWPSGPLFVAEIETARRSGVRR